MRLRVRLGVLAGLALAAVSIGSAVAQDRPLAAVDGLFSRAQAARGQQLFAATCARCHSPTQSAQLLLTQGGGQSLSDYHARLSTLMPPDVPVKPSAEDFVDILAYLVRTAGATPGDANAVLGEGAWLEASLPTGVVIDPNATVANVALPVSWTAYRGDNMGQAYSTAALITPENVGELEIVWTWSGVNQGPTPEARNITTPLMIDGVLYATAGMTRNVVAIDAVTGETLWMWRQTEGRDRYDNAPRKGAGRASP